MSTILGTVVFNVVNATPATGNPISNVPFVLRDETTGRGVIVLSNVDGLFTITNVPDGSYTLVEAWGTAGGVASPVSFLTATTIAAPTPSDPPLSSISIVPPTANAVQSLTPNTVNLNLSADARIVFSDGPVANIPVTKLDVTTTGPNLVTGVDGGTWGTFPAGSYTNFAPATEPYPGYVPGFTYVPNSPSDGQYTVFNTVNLTLYGVWWNLSDHTYRDETGRYEMINGANPGALIFRSNINVIPNTNYLLSLWIANLASVAGLVDPQLGVRVKDLSDNTLFNQVLSSITLTSIPTWNEVGTLLDVGNNNNVVLEIYSNGKAESGNDYCVDDIFLQQASVPIIMNATTTVDKSLADIGYTLNYTTSIKNNGQSTAINIIFSDTIPSGTTFKTGSVYVNGVSYPLLNPTTPGFTLPATIISGGVATVNFALDVTTVPSSNPIANSNLITYGFVPIAGGSTVIQQIVTNSALTTVNTAQLSMIKSSNKYYAKCGETLIFTTTLTNIGTVTAYNVAFVDTIPSGTSFIANSVKINGITQSGVSPNPPGGISIGTIPVGSSQSVSFQAQINC